jgi:hypothetical protein
MMPPDSRIAAWKERGLLKAALIVGGAYLALAIAFTMLTPAWENNDEADHVQYVEYVADRGTPPRISLENGHEAHQPPLYYYLAAGWQRILGIGSFTTDAPSTSPQAFMPNRYAWALYHDYTPRQHDQAVWVHELRIVSIVCGLATVLAALTTGWLLTGWVKFAAALAATVALWPKFLVVTAAVTNTALVDALCACALPCFLLWQRTGRLVWAAATGALLGTAALTQETALPVAGLMLLVMFVVAWRRSDWQAPLLAVGCFLVVAGWWYVRNAALYGDPLASQTAQAYLTKIVIFGASIVRSPPSLSPHVIHDSLITLSHSVWYDAGFNQLRLPHSFDFVVLAIAAVCIVAAFRSRIPGLLLLVACALGSVIAWLMIIRVTTLAEGRYLLVAIVPWAALLVAGATYAGRNRWMGLWLWPTIMLGLDGYVLAHWLIPHTTL